MNNTDLSLIGRQLKAVQTEMRDIRRKSERHLDPPPPPPHDPGMEQRVTRLEVEFEHVRRDLDQINGKLDRVADRLNELPSKADLRTNLQWIIGTSVGVVALFVTVLAYLQDERIDNKPEPPQVILMQPPQIAPQAAPPPQAPAPKP